MLPPLAERQPALPTRTHMLGIDGLTIPIAEALHIPIIPDPFQPQQVTVDIEALRQRSLAQYTHPDDVRLGTSAIIGRYFLPFGSSEFTAYQFALAPYRREKIRVARAQLEENSIPEDVWRSKSDAARLLPTSGTYENDVYILPQDRQSQILGRLAVVLQDRWLRKYFDPMRAPDFFEHVKQRGRQSASGFDPSKSPDPAETPLFHSGGGIPFQAFLLATLGSGISSEIHLIEKKGVENPYSAETFAYLQHRNKELWQDPLFREEADQLNGLFREFCGCS